MWTCPKGHTPETFMLPVYDLDRILTSSLRIAATVQVYPDGGLTNLYDDGTDGLAPHIRLWAETSDDAPYCPECLEEASWVETDQPPDFQTD